MNVLVFEDNLMWSSKLVQTLKSLGHTPLVKTRPEIGDVEAQAAIINLGSVVFEHQRFIPELKARGIHVIGHAGHKETQLIQFGKDAGCDTLATNSELTFKTQALLDRIENGS
jgi:hypothetical protein